MLIAVIFTLTPYLEIADSYIRIGYFISIGVSIFIIIQGVAGIILYFIAPDKLKRYIEILGGKYRYKKKSA